MVFLVLNYAAVIPVLFSVGVLSLYHFYCMMSNTTTIENWEKDKVSTMVRKGKIKEVTRILFMIIMLIIIIALSVITIY